MADKVQRKIPVPSGHISIQGKVIPMIDDYKLYQLGFIWVSTQTRIESRRRREWNGNGETGTSRESPGHFSGVPAREGRRSITPTRAFSFLLSSQRSRLDREDGVGHRFRLGNGHWKKRQTGSPGLRGRVRRFQTSQSPAGICLGLCWNIITKNHLICGPSVVHGSCVERWTRTDFLLTGSSVFHLYLSPPIPLHHLIYQLPKS